MSASSSDQSPRRLVRASRRFKSARRRQTWNKSINKKQLKTPRVVHHFQFLSSAAIETHLCKSPSLNFSNLKAISKKESPNRKSGSTVLHVCLCSCLNLQISISVIIYVKRAFIKTSSADARLQMWIKILRRPIWTWVVLYYANARQATNVFFFLMVVANCNASCYWLQLHCSQR